MLDGLEYPSKSQMVALTFAAVLFMLFVDAICWWELVAHPGEKSTETHERYLNVSVHGARL